MSRFKGLKLLWSKMPKWMNELYKPAISWDCFIIQEISFSGPEVTFDLRPVFCLTFLYLAMTCWMQLTSSCTSFVNVTTRGLDDGYDSRDVDVYFPYTFYSLPRQQQNQNIQGKCIQWLVVKMQLVEFILRMASQMSRIHQGFTNSLSRSMNQRLLGKHVKDMDQTRLSFFLKAQRNSSNFR